MRKNEDVSPYLAEWGVYTAGYEWVQELDPHDPYRFLFSPSHEIVQRSVPVEAEWAAIVAKPPFLAPRPKTSSPASRRYQLMDVPRLHRNLGETPPTLDGILGFANAYGMLGRRTWLASDPKTGEHRYVETFAAWRETIVRLGTLLALFDALDLPFYEAEARIHKIIDVPNRRRQFIRQEWIESHPGFVEALPHVTTPYVVRSDEPLDLARAYVLEHINYELAEAVSPAIQLAKGATIQLSPRDLLGAAYTHFAIEAIGHGRPPAVCKNCGRHFTQSQGNNRYCSPRCKNEAYRDRKKNKETQSIGE